MENQTTPEIKTEPKAWVTPTFEKTNLKDALTTPPNETQWDGIFYFS